MHVNSVLCPFSKPFFLAIGCGRARLSSLLQALWSIHELLSLAPLEGNERAFILPYLILRYV